MHGGRIYEYAQRSGRSPDEVFDFSANINPFGPPISVLSAIRTAMEGIRHYPDARHADVIQSIRTRHHLKEKQAVFCGNGASEIIDLIMRSIAPKRLFVFEPAFAEYHRAARRVGAKVIRISIVPGDISHMSGFAQGLTFALEMAMRGDMVVINNPHNPTGLCWQREEFIDTVEKLCEKQVTVVVDESFMDFRWDEKGKTVMGDVERLRYLVVVRSATKMYAIPGLRFGFGVAHEDLVARIDSDRDRWSVNHLAQVAAAAAYRDDRFVHETWNWLRAEQGYILETWGTHEAVQLYDPSVNYFLLRLKEAIPVHIIFQQFEREGIFVRCCEDFMGLDERYIRIAIKSHADNARLWHAFLNATENLP